jgi:hypothetical protein
MPYRDAGSDSHFMPHSQDMNEAPSLGSQNEREEVIIITCVLSLFLNFRGFVAMI